jgi:hypothetical protein
MAVEEQLGWLVSERGYASRDEAIEHLLERGLRAYEQPIGDRQKMIERLRGLGYID